MALPDNPDQARERVYSCKIGGTVALEPGAAGRMRNAIEQAYREITGREPEFMFDGWGDTLTEGERAVVEDRLPDPRKVLAEVDDLIELRQSTLSYLGQQ